MSCSLQILAVPEFALRCLKPSCICISQNTLCLFVSASEFYKQCFWPPSVSFASCLVLTFESDSLRIRYTEQGWFWLNLDYIYFYKGSRAVVIFAMKEHTQTPCTFCHLPRKSGPKMQTQCRELTDQKQVLLQKKQMPKLNKGSKNKTKTTKTTKNKNKTTNRDKGQNGDAGPGNNNSTRGRQHAVWQRQKGKHRHYIALGVMRQRWGNQHRGNTSGQGR